MRDLGKIRDRSLEFTDERSVVGQPGPVEHLLDTPTQAFVIADVRASCVEEIRERGFAAEERKPCNTMNRHQSSCSRTPPAELSHYPEEHFLYGQETGADCLFNHCYDADRS